MSNEGERSMGGQGAPCDVWIALGSNLGDRTKHLNQALDLLHGHERVSVQRVSAFYETEAKYVTDQPAFVNACAHLRTTLDPVQMMRLLLEIELKLGRIRDDRAIHMGPRTLDLDMLFWGDGRRIQEGELLRVPHPRLHERAFVLGPLCDIAPDYAHPDFPGHTVTTLHDALGATERESVIRCDGVAEWRPPQTS